MILYAVKYMSDECHPMTSWCPTARAARARRKELIADGASPDVQIDRVVVPTLTRAAMAAFLNVYDVGCCQ